MKFLLLLMLLMMLVNGNLYHDEQEVHAFEGMNERNVRSPPSQEEPEFIPDYHLDDEL